MNDIIEWLDSPSGELWQLRQFYRPDRRQTFHGTGIFGEIKAQVSLDADVAEDCRCSEAMRWYPRGCQDVQSGP